MALRALQGVGDIPFSPWPIGRPGQPVGRSARRRTWRPRPGAGYLASNCALPIAGPSPAVRGIDPRRFSPPSPQKVQSRSAFPICSSQKVNLAWASDVALSKSRSRPGFPPADSGFRVAAGHSPNIGSGFRSLIQIQSGLNERGVASLGSRQPEFTPVSDRFQVSLKRPR
jgi:hypothetical protein